MNESKSTGNATNYKSESTAVEDTCHWSYDSFCDYWTAACGLTWQIIDGNLPENNMNYCPKCGHKITETVPATAVEEGVGDG